MELKKIHKLEVVVLNKFRNPVYEFAVKKNLKAHIWPPLITQSFDLGIAASFGKLIPESIIVHFSLGIINVHGSLLPQYRGSNPIFHAIKNGDSVTGISITIIKPEKFDIGDIVIQETCDIGKNECMPSLRKKLAQLGAKCVSQTIENLPQCLDDCVPQGTHKISFAPKINKDISFIHWENLTAAQIYNLYRAGLGKFDLKTNINSRTVKLKCISLDCIKRPTSFSISSRLSPGYIEYCTTTRTMRVHCLDKPIYICSVQVKDKVLQAFDFYRGYLQNLSRKQWLFK